MKKTLTVTAFAALLAVNVVAQGTFNGLNNTAAISVDGTLAGAGEAQGQWMGGAAAGSIAPVGPVLDVLANGLVSGGQIGIDGTSAGGEGFVALQAWATGNEGNPSQTATVSVSPLGGGTPPTPGPRPDFGGGGLDVSSSPIIPEPSTIALTLLGAAALLFVRRRK